jgi:hypothetical protein
VSAREASSVISICRVSITIFFEGIKIVKVNDAAMPGRLEMRIFKAGQLADSFTDENLFVNDARHNDDSGFVTEDLFLKLTREVFRCFPLQHADLPMKKIDSFPGEDLESPSI